jgi:hypothetical protein
MQVHELVIEMKQLERRLTLYEEKYGILSPDFYAALTAGKLARFDEYDESRGDFSRWKGIYETWLRAQAQLRRADAQARRRADIALPSRLLSYPHLDVRWQPEQSPLLPLRVQPFFLAELLNEPDVLRSTVTVWSDSPYTGTAQGEVLFRDGVRLRVRERVHRVAASLAAPLSGSVKEKLLPRPTSLSTKIRFTATTSPPRGGSLPRSA